MEIASNKGVIADASTPAGRAGMSESEWREAIKFDSTDTGWVIMSIGMAIGAGIVFLPVQVGLMGLWVFLLSSVIGYPAMYLFQRLFINTLAESPECKDYPSVISGYLGKNWGILLGALYFVMLVIWMFVYSTAITNDSASYLHTFGVTEGLLSDSPFYGLVLICILVAISSRGEKLLFKISTGMVLTKLLVVAALGVSMVGMWHLYNVGSLPPLGLLVKNAIITLPFTLTSILFIQTLSPMVISYRSREKSIEVARHKALRAMNIAFGILFVTVFFYAVSFTLAMGHDEAVKAYEQNISALALAAAVAAAELEGPVERVEAWVSPNLMKNGLGVTVPGTGMVGLPIAAALGALGGNANAGLEVLKDATAQAIADAKALLAAGKVSVKIQEPCNEILFSRAKVWNGEKWACVTIVGGHTNIVHIETHNGVVFTQQACVAEGEQESPLTVLSRTTLAEILKFVNEVPFAAIRFILDSAKLNCALSQEGLSGKWGLHIGATLEKQCERGLLAKDLSSSIVIRTSAASDARMGGATLPAMSNSGSGNQGITATMPVVVVAEHFGADDERLARALMLSHLSAIYIHNQLPRLSALCAATTAAMGAAAGMAWLVDGRYETISMAISSMIGDVSGMICDGASNSCAMKVSTSASAAWKAVLMALDDTAVTGNEGIVAHDVEQSIANLCALASHSMQQTDRQIIEIMASKAR